MRNAAAAASGAQEGKTRQEIPRWELLEKYLPLVKSIVARMRMNFPQQTDIEDIYSIAVGGLIESIRRCDDEKDKYFGRFAALRIRGALLDELRRMDWLPRQGRHDAKRLRIAAQELEQRLGRPATEQEIADALGVSRHEYYRLREQTRTITLVSMDSAADPGETEHATGHEVLCDDTELNARERCEKREIVHLLRERIEQLSDTQRKIVTMYYFEGMRLAEIAKVFDLTESRICQIHTQAVISLRSYLDDIADR